MTLYLTAGQVIDIHDKVIADFGGSAGIRDYALLESAVARPRQGYYRDLIAEAAALWESLTQNHPFVDGNKRTAFHATHIFLRLNGIEIIDADGKLIAGDASAGIDFIMHAYQHGLVTRDHLEAWLR